MVNKFFSIHVIFIFVLQFTPNHTPLKYRRPFKIRIQIRHIDLSSKEHIGFEDPKSLPKETSF